MARRDSGGWGVIKFLICVVDTYLYLGDMR